MLSSLKPEEMEQLTAHFRLTTTPSPDRELSVPSADLLDEDRCLDYLDRVTSLLHSPSLLVTASLFAKMYSFITVAPGLYAMSMFNKGWDHSIENCLIESSYQHEHWLPNMRFIDWQATHPFDGNRYKWRDEVIRNIFAGNLAKMWHSLSKRARIPIEVLWENTAVNVYWLYEKKIGEAARGDQISRIHEDFQYLLHEAPASLFGETVNPLARFDHEKRVTASSDQPLRIRKTCCYHYRISPKPVYCSICPRNKRK